jgi:lincosamide nucleotidyltransferase A/C/D/E
LSAFRNLLADLGYDEIKIGIARPHNFVLSDNHQHEIDVHVILFNDKGDGIYGPPQQGGLYPAASLTGKGKIAGQEVHCISPEYAVSFHSGYAMKEKD